MKSFGVSNTWPATIKYGRSTQVLCRRRGHLLHGVIHGFNCVQWHVVWDWDCVHCAKIILREEIVVALRIGISMKLMLRIEKETVLSCVAKARRCHARGRSTAFITVAAKSKRGHRGWRALRKCR